jgi:hypothetical protein
MYSFFMSLSGFMGSEWEGGKAEKTKKYLEVALVPRRLTLLTLVECGVDDVVATTTSCLDQVTVSHDDFVVNPTIRR